MSLERIGKYLQAELRQREAGKKTDNWVLFGQSGDPLGTVGWYWAWRQYCFEALPNTVWSHDCLEDVTKFLNRVKSDQPENTQQREKESMTNEEIGPTGKYPAGRLNQDDDGEIKIAIAADTNTGKIVIDFGGPVAWLGLDAQHARALARLLEDKANEVTQNTLH